MEEFRNFNDITKDIIELRREVFIEEQNVPIELELEVEEDQYVHCCLYLEDLLIAYARVSLSNPINIGRVCVKKEYRCQGFGEKIMKYAEIQIPKHNVDIVIHAQKQAEKFYARLGYISFGETFMEANIEHISMKKRKV